MTQKRKWKDKFEQQAWKWAHRHGITALTIDLSNLLRRTANTAAEDAIIEGIKIGGRVAISAMESRTKEEKAWDDQQIP